MISCVSVPSFSCFTCLVHFLTLPGFAGLLTSVMSSSSSPNDDTGSNTPVTAVTKEASVVRVSAGSGLSDSRSSLRLVPLKVVIPCNMKELLSLLLADTGPQSSVWFCLSISWHKVQQLAPTPCPVNSTQGTRISVSTILPPTKATVAMKQLQLWTVAIETNGIRAQNGLDSPQSLGHCTKLCGRREDSCDRMDLQL